MKKFVLFISLFLFACSTEIDTSGLTPDDVQVAPAEVTQMFYVHGSVVSAFEVTVDGSMYYDMEDYYTQALNSFERQMDSLNYGADRQLTFDAQIGLGDLPRNMNVYVRSVYDRGFAGSAKVNSDGLFEVSMPIEAAGDSYSVRANKRVSVVMKDANQTNEYCYNFSAVEVEVPYEETDKPLILDTFQTSLTQYKCSQASSETPIQIPDHAPDTTEPKIHPTNSDTALRPNQVYGPDSALLELLNPTDNSKHYGIAEYCDTIGHPYEPNGCNVKYFYSSDKCLDDGDCSIIYVISVAGGPHNTKIEILCARHLKQKYALPNEYWPKSCFSP